MPRHPDGHMRKLLTGIVCIVCLSLATTARAQSVEQKLVDEARWTAERMLSDPGYTALRRWLRRARAVMVIPSLLKGGFLIGGESGTGVLVARNPDGSWGYPAFYSIASGSIGLQAGIQDSEVMFVIMTDKGLQAVLQSRFKLGVDASLAAGPLGGTGVEGSTTAAFTADIYSFSRNRGVFIGISFEGTVTSEQRAQNRAYYGRMVTGADIVLGGRLRHPGADALRRALTIR